MKTTLRRRLLTPAAERTMRGVLCVSLYLWSLVLVPVATLVALVRGMEFGEGLATMAGAALLGFVMSLAGAAVDPENQKD